MPPVHAELHPVSGRPAGHPELKTLDIPERMLRRMMGVSGDGLHDHLMDFTRAVTGAHFFAPSLKVLKALGKH